MTRPKKILLIHGALPLGGIETHIVRLAEELNRRGIEVRILLLRKSYDTEIMIELEKYATVYFATDILKYNFPAVRRNLQMMAVMPMAKRKISEIVRDIDCIHVCGIWSLVFYFKNIFDIDRNIKVVCGVYHQNEFNFVSVKPLFLRKLLLKIVGSCLKLESMIFFNEKSVRTARHLYGLNYKITSVFPIGIKFDNSKVDARVNWKSRNIVSIGRVTNFKTYNFKVVECLTEIIKMDPRFQYHVYGDGEKMQDLKRLVVNHGLSGSVFLHGSIPYKEFGTIMNDAFIFIGSGTAILEAAAMGVPSIIGIESDDVGLTYGLLSNMGGYSYHEKGLDYDVHPIFDVIKDVSELSLHDYMNVSEKARLKASEFSIKHLADLYIDYISNNSLSPIKNVKFSLPIYIVGILSCFAIGIVNKERTFGSRY